MKKTTQVVLSGVLFLSTIIATAQINTRTGGATNVLANSPTTNTNVGIGTNTPKSKLDVKGNLTVGSTYGGVSIAPISGAIIEGSVGIGTTTPVSKLDVEGGVSIGATYSGTTAAPTNGAIIEGNVGIGTTTPSAKLDVNGDIKASTGIFTKSPANGSVFTSDDDRNKKSLVLSAGSLLPGYPIEQEVRMLRFYDFPQSNGLLKPWLYFSLEDRLDSRRFRVAAETGGNTEMSVWNRNQEPLMRMYEDGLDNVYMDMPKPNSRIIIGGWGDYLPEHKLVVRGSSKIEGNILTDANIGIGTSNFVDGIDTYRLSVNGSIRANRVKVYTTWADYVFEKNYKLPTLEEVEKQIKTKGHLKDIPSAKEVEGKGIELGEMNKLLLQKVEELTLYVIQLNKELKEIKNIKD